MSGKRVGEKAIEETVRALKHSIDLHPTNRASIETLLPDVAIGRKRLLKVFKAITGYSFVGYQRFKRMEAASSMLLAGMTVKEAAIECGYNAYVGNFSRDFKAIFNKGPDEWLKDGARNDRGHTMKALRKQG